MSNKGVDFRQQAESILNTTESVIGALSKASEAQDKAEKAIKYANVDIDSAQSDLHKVSERCCEWVLSPYGYQVVLLEDGVREGLVDCASPGARNLQKDLRLGSLRRPIHFALRFRFPTKLWRRKSQQTNRRRR